MRSCQCIFCGELFKFYNTEEDFYEDSLYARHLSDCDVRKLFLEKESLKLQKLRLEIVKLKRELEVPNDETEKL
jgi:hypothetical protein